MGDACLWGAALVVHLLQQRGDFELGDIGRRILFEAELAGDTGERKSVELNWQDGQPRRVRAEEVGVCIAFVPEGDFPLWEKFCKRS